MKIVGLTFECRKPVEGSVAEGNASEAPPPIDEETLEVAAELAEAGGFTPLDFERMTVEQLKEYAEAGDIDLGKAKTKAEIIAAIIAAMSAADVPETE